MITATLGVAVGLMIGSPCSGDNIWNDLIFDLGDPVLDRQLFLLHALDPQLIASRLESWR
jgi:hypothetical protein